MKKLKKWNWGAFWFIMIISCIGVLSNKTIPDIKSCLMAAALFGVPMGLIWAYISRDE